MESVLEAGGRNLSEPNPQTEDPCKVLEVGSKHTVVVEEVASGTILVSLSLDNRQFKGVLLDTSNRLGPVVLPKRSDPAPEENVFELNYNATDDLGSSSQLRSTYQIDSNPTSPTKSLTSFLNRSPRSQRLRSNLFKPKLLLCSMCKSHYKYTEETDLKHSTPKDEGAGDSRSHSSHKKSKNKQKKSHKRKQKKSKLKKLHIRLTEIQIPEVVPSDNSPVASEVMDPYMFTGSQSPEPDQHQSDTGTIAETQRSDRHATPKRRSKTPQKRTPAKKHKTTPKKEHEAVLEEARPVESEPVKKAVLEGGKVFVIGDVIWGKIMGFPWWPGRITLLFKRSDSEYDAEVDWYNSNTKSVINCNQLSLFLDDYERRLDRRKKTKSYQKAVEDAKSAAIVNAQLSTMDTSSDEEITLNLPQSAHGAHNSSLHQPTSAATEHSPILSNNMFVRENNSQSPDHKPHPIRRNTFDVFGDPLSPPILHTDDLLEDPDSSPYKRTTPNGSRDVTSTQPLL